MAEKPLDPDVCDSCRSLRPATPPAESCCGSGCALCVYDIHDQEIALWMKNCHRKHGIAQEDAEKEEGATMDPMEYREYPLDSITPICSSTSVYRFSLPPGRRLNLSIAKHIILRGRVNGRVITRQYTPISHPETTGYFDVLIKLYDNGQMSRFVERWRVGDQVEWRGTFGSFIYQPNQVDRVLILGAGTGITPLIQVMRHIVADEGDETMVRVAYSCRSYAEVLLRDELNELALFWNINVTYFLSQDSASNHSTEYGETIQYGRITKSTIEKEAELAGGGRLRALVCGTRSFEDDMIALLRGAGVEEAWISKF